MNSIIDQLIEEFQLPLQNPVLIFSLILFIILLAPVVLNRIRIPGIIGLIVSGIIIGPAGLNILEKSLFVDVFSTIGLLYIMFIAGLELDLNEFKATRNKSLLFGFLTFTIPLGIGFPVCHYLLGFDFNASLLTSSMFATHTLVTYPIVSKLGVSKNAAVAITVGGTIITDTAVLIMLAVILGSHNGGLTQEFWIRLGVSLAVFSAIMFLVIPRIAKWFFRKLESEKHSHYIFVLSVVFFSAFLAEMAGLESIIGAFVAGLALNKLIPHSSALMNRIGFIGNSLFIPFFLISVGMLVDISVIFSGPMALVIASTLTVVAILGKWLAAFFTQIVFRFSKGQRKLIFGLSSAHAAATLAVILVGYKAGILDDNILNGTVVLILVTCIIASFATESAAKEIIHNSDEDDSLELSSLTKGETILIPIANLVNIEKVLDFAVLIKEKKSPNALHMLTVVPNTDEAEKAIFKSKQGLESFIKETTASDTNAKIMATIDHNAASGISRTAKEIMADIILLGWPQKTGFLDKLIGDKMESILENTDKTLFICDFEMPLVNHKRLFLVVPPNAEMEEGFAIWIHKIAKLSLELSIPIHLYCTKETYTSILKYAKTNKLTMTLNYHNFKDWEDFLILSKVINDSDFIILVSARRGYISYFGQLDKIPAKLEKHFSELSKMIIYPQ
ncbi:cation:proton antiporter [Bizionia argentinensis JUB59]|uniref:Cation:proton antiporter n=1 Tax=Bizionia argentinensis JUB59 TaxID=1046627 RepID=G2EA03_9FLAO|nr:cation:proton antiporter [Bizionia argentinensis]EGV44769.1 cation:proton antiporter [Bizionia argentinensis JUB59]